MTAENGTAENGTAENGTAENGTAENGTADECLPRLRDPIVIAAFEGWNDAGDAATAAVEHLETAWQARQLAALDPDDYYDFQVNRPTVSLVDGVTRRISWPTSRISYARLEPRDVVLLRGLEPNMRWRAFCRELLAVLGELGATRVITLGALLADAPHTRPVPVSGTSSDEDSVESLGMQRSNYEGPTGIVGVFQDAAAQAGFSSVSLWAAVPHYVSQPPCPKATLALLHRIEDVLDVAIPLGTLPELARSWERGVDELAREDSEVAEYVAALEQRQADTELPSATGDSIAREFERYLRRRDNP